MLRCCGGEDEKVARVAVNALQDIFWSHQVFSSEKILKTVPQILTLPSQQVVAEGFSVDVSSSPVAHIMLIWFWVDFFTG